MYKILCVLGIALLVPSNFATVQQIIRSPMQSSVEFLPEGFDRSNVTALKELFNSLKNRQSIVELATYVAQQNGTQVPPFNPQQSRATYEQQSQKLCQQQQTYKQKLQDAIGRTLNFYQNQVDQLASVDAAIALATINVIDKKHGSRFQQYNIPQLTQRIINQISFQKDQNVSRAFVKVIEQAQSTRSYQPASVLQQASQQYQQHIGKDNETAWAPLNQHCFYALLFRSEVPTICEQVIFSEQAQSQYQLVQQLFHRIIAAKAVPSQKQFQNQQVNSQLAAKMLQEAQLLVHLDNYIEVTYFRELLAVQIAFAGESGYPNFFRADWLEQILSYQSKDNYGCFVNQAPLPGQLVDSDVPVMQKPIRAVPQHRVNNQEVCKPQFTSAALMAISQYLNYIEVHCSQ